MGSSVSASPSANASPTASVAATAVPSARVTATAARSMPGSSGRALATAFAKARVAACTVLVGGSVSLSFTGFVGVL